MLLQQLNRFIRANFARHLDRILVSIVKFVDGHIRTLFEQQFDGLVPQSLILTTKRPVERRFLRYRCNDLGATLQKLSCTINQSSTILEPKSNHIAGNR